MDLPSRQRGKCLYVGGWWPEHPSNGHCPGTESACRPQVRVRVRTMSASRKVHMLVLCKPHMYTILSPYLTLCDFNVCRTRSANFR